MEYDKGYVDGIKASITAGFSKPEYSFRIGEEGDKLNAIPPLEVIRFLDDMEDLDHQSLIAKRAINGKKVALLVNGEQFGTGFLVKGLDYEWEQFQEFVEHPLALMSLFEICSSYVLKNSKLLSEKKPVATAEAKG